MLVLILVVAAVVASRVDLSPDGEVATALAFDRRFIRVGTDDGEPLSDDEVDELATHYGYVLFSKAHAGWNIEAHHADARRIKAANPDVRVLPYFSTKYWFDENEWGVEIDPDWLLRDNDGQLIPKTRGGEEQEGGRYADLANPDFRAWALEVLASWLEAAPYDGLSFDAADPIGDHDPEEIERWTRLLGPDRIDAYNAGIRDLLSRAGELIGPGQEVLYNGFAPIPIRGPGRDLDLLEITDGALDERFCLDRKGNSSFIDEDLALMRDTVDDKLFLRTVLPARLSDGERDRLARFCVGSFLLGWVPGRTFFQLAEDYTTKQLARDHPDVEVDVGDPTGPAEGKTVRTRAYSKGMVAVNLGDEPATFTVPAAMSVVEGGRTAAALDAGAEVTIPAYDALLLVARA